MASLSCLIKPSSSCFFRGPNCDLPTWRHSLWFGLALMRNTGKEIKPFDSVGKVLMWQLLVVFFHDLKNLSLPPSPSPHLHSSIYPSFLFHFIFKNKVFVQFQLLSREWILGRLVFFDCTVDDEGRHRLFEMPSLHHSTQGKLQLRCRSTVSCWYSVLLCRVPPLVVFHWFLGQQSPFFPFLLLLFLFHPDQRVRMGWSANDDALINQMVWWTIPLLSAADNWRFWRWPSIAD